MSIKHDRCVYERSTVMAKRMVAYTIDLADKFSNDPEKRKRLEECLCPICYYEKSRIGGSAIRTVECVCGKEMHFANTCTDNLCDDCAEDRGCCKHCGGDLNIKLRRKLNF